MALDDHKLNIAIENVLETALKNAREVNGVTRIKVYKNNAWHKTHILTKNELDVLQKFLKKSNIDFYDSTYEKCCCFFGIPKYSEYMYINEGLNELVDKLSKARPDLALMLANYKIPTRNLKLEKVLEKLLQEAIPNGATTKCNIQCWPSEEQKILKNFFKTPGIEADIKFYYSRSFQNWCCGVFCGIVDSAPSDWDEITFETNIDDLIDKLKKYLPITSEISDTQLLRPL